MAISLSDIKKEKIRSLCTEILNEEFPVIRTVARLLGKFSTSFPAVQFGRLHYRALERDKIEALKFKKGNFDKKMTISSDLEVRKIWEWATMRNNFITAAHIPGILNVEADAESRNSETRTEWKLNEALFRSILHHFRCSPSVDLFASRINPQLPRFFAYRPDPNAEVINAFTVNWNKVDFYCFPPFSCIGKV